MSFQMFESKHRKEVRGYLIEVYKLKPWQADDFIDEHMLQLNDPNYERKEIAA